MGGIGIDAAGEETLPPGVVELLDPEGIPPEGLGRGHVLDPDLGPDAVGVAEGMETGLAGDPRAGQNDDGVSCREPHPAAASTR